MRSSSLSSTSSLPQYCPRRPPILNSSPLLRWANSEAAEAAPEAGEAVLEAAEAVPEAAEAVPEAVKAPSPPHPPEPGLERDMLPPEELRGQ